MSSEYVPSPDKSPADSRDPVLGLVNPALAGVSRSYIERRLRQILQQRDASYAPPAGHSAVLDGCRGGPVDAQEAEAWWQTRDNLPVDARAVDEVNDILTYDTYGAAADLVEGTQFHAQQILLEAYADAQRIRDQAEDDARRIRGAAARVAMRIRENAAASHQCSHHSDDTAPQLSRAT